MSRLDVLRLYKHLHRTVQTVFKGDIRAQILARDRICADFDKNRNVSNAKAVAELVKYGNECADVLRTQVIQANMVNAGTDGQKPVYKAMVRDPAQLVENREFRADVTEEEYKASIRAERKRQKEGKKSPCEENSN